ncbi:MAG: beta-propeller domain-containing protein [Deltaproteobacteria bacterium]|nr:beta-propeller domain-containing protein [Deltaproteobacteria bacterium]
MNHRTAVRPWIRFSLTVAAAGVAAATSQGCFLFPTYCDEMMADSGGQGGNNVVPAADANRAILEADIVQIVDDRLYALSSTAGLNVIDLSVPGELTLLDQADSALGQPFEMYVLDGRVVALADAAEGDHHSSVQIFDVTDPTDIRFTGGEAVAGHVSDSRIVGDVLYLVTHEDHVCSGCNPDPTTTIASFRFGEGSAITKVDELSYQQPDVQNRGWKRSVMVTTERMYVAGVAWDGWSEEGHSTIQVIDISDPEGDLVEGTQVEAAGQILNRWQMDEREGVLRVVSQPGVWSTADVPTVQTFGIESAQLLEPMASVDLTLPTPESLRSVRFDGDRAYAITAQAPEPYDPTAGADVELPQPPVDSCGPNCDPLIVIDLSDAWEPVQLGELEMPGWVFHMEPRGNRLMALGFESTYPLGPLSVSLFDVADGAAPKLVERVTFGGQWAGLAEDQNRIHKAFTIVDELGLILVPYGWWGWEEDLQCSEFEGCDGDTYTSCWDSGDWARRGAVQLIDFTTDTLVARGQANLDSWALRAMIHDQSLLAVSDDEVSRFDVTDRDQPSEDANLVF